MSGNVTQPPLCVPITDNRLLITDNRLKMSVQSCAICDGNLIDKRRYGGTGLANGANCPICYRPICGYHLTVVRWRWRDSRQIDSAHICQECRRSYAHRHWDAVNRDWIT